MKVHSQKTLRGQPQMLRYGLDDLLAGSKPWWYAGPSMILEALTGREVRKRRSQMPQRHGNGGFTQLSGEDRLVSSGISWHSYLELDEVLGHERPGPRLYYLDGELEIMTTSLLHEKLKEWIGVLVEDYLFEVGRETFPHGQATMRIFKEAGAEPDKSHGVSTGIRSGRILFWRLL